MIHLQLRLKYTAAIQHNVAAIDMACCSRAEIYHCTGDIFWQTHSSVRAGFSELLRPTTELHEAAGHLCRKEAGRNGIAEDVLRSELESQVSREVQYSCFGSTVRERRILTERTNADASNGCRSDHARRVFKRCILSQKWCEPGSVNRLLLAL